VAIAGPAAFPQANLRLDRLHHLAVGVSFSEQLDATGRRAPRFDRRSIRSGSIRPAVLHTRVVWRAKKGRLCQAAPRAQGVQAEGPPAAIDRSNSQRRTEARQLAQWHPPPDTGEERSVGSTASNAPWLAGSQATDAPDLYPVDQLKTDTATLAGSCLQFGPHRSPGSLRGATTQGTRWAGGGAVITADSARLPVRGGTVCCLATTASTPPARRRPQVPRHSNGAQSIIPSALLCCPGGPQPCPKLSTGDRLR